MRRLLALARWSGDALVALLLFLMMMVTFVDVSGRYLLHRPLPGSSEMTRYLLALVIFISLPTITARNAHISISILDGALPGAVNSWRLRIVNAISGTAMMAAAYYMWRYAGILLENGDVIGASLLPLAPAGYAVSVLSFLTAFTFFARCRQPTS